MPTVKVRNLKNEEVGDFELSDAVFGAELNEGLIHTAVKAFLANARQGTVGTKTRGDVSGSGRKLWKQKGTGRARIASIRSPLWKGGGNVHGPQARDWSQPIPKKMRRGALRSALSERLREGNLVVVDELSFGGPKTKDFVAALVALGFGDAKTLIVDALDNDNLLLSARNVKKAKVVGSSGLNIYDVLYHEKLVLSRRAAEQVARALDPKRKGGPAGEGTEAEAGDDSAAEAEEAA
jgi:large subunit ribosomal protein L4